MSDHDRRLVDACKKFIGLMNEPEPGLSTWVTFYQNNLLEIAKALPAEVWQQLAEEKKEGEQRFVVRERLCELDEMEPGDIRPFASGCVQIFLQLTEGDFPKLPQPLEVVLRAAGPDEAPRPKLTEEELAQKLWEASAALYRQWPYKHLKSGDIYEIDNFAIRESDGEPMVMYSQRRRSMGDRPLKGVMFCRPIVEFRKKFEALK